MSQTKRRGTVYIVDDDDAVRTSLELSLQAQGFKVSGFNRASSFLIEYTAVEPACLVLDVSMPAMNGMQVLDALADRQLTLPTILATGQDLLCEETRKQRPEVVACLEKPFGVADLVGHIEAVFK